jgi:SAM-dependent methyltransferase
MTKEQTGGVSARSIHWPAPRSFCRAQLITAFLRGRADTFIDAGCGDGYMSERLARLGLRGKAIDASPEAVELTRERLRTREIQGVDVLTGDIFDAPLQEGAADAVTFLEVLEHLDDDIAALKRLRQLVRQGGFLVLSVPAHEKLWDELDEWAGHVRRYEREELIGKLKSTGWRPIKVYNYGFPLINLTRNVRATFYSRLSRKHAAESKREATLRSGVHPDGYVSGLGWLWTAYGFAASILQRPFLRTDWGEGYLVIARREEV